MGFKKILTAALVLVSFTAANSVACTPVADAARGPASAKAKDAKKGKKKDKAKKSGGEKKKAKAKAKTKSVKAAKGKKAAKTGRKKAAKASGHRSHAPADPFDMGNNTGTASVDDIPENLKDDLPPPNNGDLSD